MRVRLGGQILTGVAVAIAATGAIAPSIPFLQFCNPTVGALAQREAVFGLAFRQEILASHR